MKLNNAEIDTSNSGFTIDNPNTDIYLAGFRKIYSFPDYLTPRHYAYTSRYENIKRIQSGSDIYHETFSNYKIPERSSDRYITVNSSLENRLDIISARYYKSPIMWWIIALANNIIDPFTEIKIGTTLRIPELTTIYELDIL